MQSIPQVNTSAPTLLAVEWEGKTRTLEVAPQVWSQICAGEQIQIAGPPYQSDGEAIPTGWIFNAFPDASLIVAYGEDGGVAFEGPVQSAVAKR